MDPRRVALWMLATAGVAVGHILGYGLAHPDDAAREAALGGHAYLPLAASVLVPLGVLVALVWGVRTSRSLGLELRTRDLVAAQVAVFAVQEVGERFVAGIPPSDLLTERGVWFGLLAQFLVAHLVARSVTWVRSVARAIGAGRRLLPTPLVAPLPFVPAPVLRPAPATVAVGSRAPPVVVDHR